MSKVKRFFLEIELKKNKYIEVNIPKNYKIILEEKKDFNINKFFYKQVGAEHHWRDRLVWSDNDWKKYVSNKNLETWIVKTNNQLAGFYEKEFHEKRNEVELINMGVLKEYRGKKLGAALLQHVLNLSQIAKHNRIWVHTCTLDHKFALPNYLSRGFKIFKEEEIDFVA